jgi:membrane protease subunit HflC
MAQMRQQLDQGAREFGIDVVDVRIRRADFPLQNSQAVYKRMQTEREREAAEFRGQGAQKAQAIRARADRDVTVIIAQANSQAETIRGQGDAESNAIYAQAFGQDPGFFAFYRSMRAYEKSMESANTKLVLGPNLDFFRYFGNPTGQVPAVKSATAPSAAVPTDSHAVATVPAK